MYVHEVRNKAFHISVDLQRLRAYDLPALIEYELRILSEHVEELVRFSDSIKRLPGGRAVQESLEECVGQVSSILSPILAREHASLDVSLGGRSALVVVPKVDLEQVLLNLVANAIDAIGKTPIERHVIRIKASAAEGILYIAVSDEGIGIPQNDLERIFEPFTSRTASRTGLGLYLTRAIVEGLNGRISVESEVGIGSTFSINLPYQEE